jgi:hypothetical protein
VVGISPALHKWATSSALTTARTQWLALREYAREAWCPCAAAARQVRMGPGGGAMTRSQAGSRVKRAERRSGLSAQSGSGGALLHSEEPARRSRCTAGTRPAPASPMLDRNILLDYMLYWLTIFEVGILVVSQCPCGDPDRQRPAVPEYWADHRYLHSYRVSFLVLTTCCTG